MLSKMIGKQVGKVFLGALGNTLCPGLGGVIGGVIGSALGGAYVDVASDPDNWALGFEVMTEIGIL